MPCECNLTNPKSGTWIAVVGPDGSGKSTFVDELGRMLEARGHSVARTHGRPQAIARRRPPEDADPSEPHARGPRGPVLSLGKYLLAAVDFLLARRRLLREHDAWISERPLLDYEVDPDRYQLDHRVLALIRRLNQGLARPHSIILLTGDANEMADRKGELAASEIERQLTEWRRTESRVPIPFHAISTTSGRTVAEVAADALAVLDLPPSCGLAWRIAPLKPTRLDVRMAGHDTAALDVYRPIRLVARSADAVGRLLVTAHATPRTSTPDPAVDALVAVLQRDGAVITGVAAMASSTARRWVVGLARCGHLVHVAKVGPIDDPGLAREVANLGRLKETNGLDSVRTPLAHTVALDIDRAVLMTSAPEGQLAPLTDVAAAVHVATELAQHNWTHGDLAPWNAFRDEHGGLHLIDWELAEQRLRPLWDMVHFLVRLGATTHPRESRSALAALARAAPTFRRLLDASGVMPTAAAVAPHVGSYLVSTHDEVMSSAEGNIRSWLATQFDVPKRSNS